jgi:multisubunit Na+/H+ antiporter MnhB subunit
MTGSNHDESPNVPAPVRSGMIMAIGVVLGFTFISFTSWSTDPEPWQSSHLPALIFFLFGITTLVIALVLSVKPENISKSHFKLTTILMVVGIGLFVAGAALAILLSFQDGSEKGRRPHDKPRSKAQACECNCDCGNDKSHRTRRR